MHRSIMSASGQGAGSRIESVPCWETGPARERSEAGAPSPLVGAPRVEGKFLSRGGRRLRAKGVIYGPFPPGDEGHQFPEPGRVRDDFARMLDVGVNAIRTYHVPPAWLLEEAQRQGLSVLVDIP